MVWPLSLCSPFLTEVLIPFGVDLALRVCCLVVLSSLPVFINQPDDSILILKVDLLMSDGMYIATLPTGSRDGVSEFEDGSSQVSLSQLCWCKMKQIEIF